MVTLAVSTEISFYLFGEIAKVLLISEKTHQMKVINKYWNNGGIIRERKWNKTQVIAVVDLNVIV